MTAETVTVDVRQEHIDRGKTFNPYACPIALAARAAGFKTATMHYRGGQLRLTALKGYASVYVNVDAGVFAERFDLGKPVKPCSFTFERGAP